MRWCKHFSLAYWASPLSLYFVTGDIFHSHTSILFFFGKKDLTFTTMIFYSYRKCLHPLHHYAFILSSELETNTKLAALFSYSKEHFYIGKKRCFF